MAPIIQEVFLLFLVFDAHFGSFERFWTICPTSSFGSDAERGARKRLEELRLGDRDRYIRRYDLGWAGSPIFAIQSGS
jgi:hypothetical protein